MKKKILSFVLVNMLIINTFTYMDVMATPNVTEAQQKYEELKKKEEDIHDKIEELNVVIEPLIVQAEENKRKMDELNREIDLSKNEIENTKIELEENQKMVSGRLRELYKNGGQTDVVSIIFSSDSISDLFSRMDAVNRITKADKAIINDIKRKQEKLNKKHKELEEKSLELVEIDKINKIKREEIQVKINEQNQLIAQAKEETKKYEKEVLVVEEGLLVKDLIRVCTSSSSSLSAIKDAKSQLEIILRQLKTQSVINDVKAAINKGNELIRIKEQEQNNDNDQGGSSGGNAGGGSSGGNTGGGSSGGNTGGDSGGQPSQSVEAVINEAYKHLGKDYEWGATGPNTFDCSGFTSYVYKKATGINIGRNTGAQINSGREVSRGELKPGDLVFTHPGHVGLYIGNGNMIHAPQTGDVVKISSVYKFWRARRIIG
ncbi:MAG: NlpC/P60 family protein [Clostridium sp.]